LTDKFCEALRQPGDIAAQVLAAFLVPFHGLAQLSAAQAGTLESVTEGAPNEFVLIAAEAIVRVAVHPKNLWR
jgi:hypothetical protein